MDLMDSHTFYLPSPGWRLHAVLEKVKLSIYDGFIIYFYEWQGATVIEEFSFQI